MAWSFQLNTYPSTGGEAMWSFKQFMVSLGWDVPRSGSGSGGAYGNVTDPILPADVHAPGGTYGGTLDLANAWFELRQPVAASPRRSFMFLNTTTSGHTWRVWYSSNSEGFIWSYSGTGDSIALVSGNTYRLTDSASTFVAGDVGSTIRITGATSTANNGNFTVVAASGNTIDYTNPSGIAEAYTGTWVLGNSSRVGTGLTASLRGRADDEQGLINTPALSSQVLPNNSTYRLDIIAGSAEEGFSFFLGVRNSFINSTAGTEGYHSVLSLDVLEDSNALDQDPAIVGCHITTAGRFALENNFFMYSNPTPTQTGSVSRGWFRKNLSSAAYVAYPMAFIGTGISTFFPLNNSLTMQNSNGALIEFPVWYWRGGPNATTSRGKKGRSRLYRTMQLKYGVYRPNSDFTRMSIGVLSIPWDGSTKPIF